MKTATALMSKFPLVPKDRRLINDIARRAAQMAKESGILYRYEEAQSDIAAIHCTTPLNLEKLLNFADGDFGHDAFGIRKNIDRPNGKLTDDFRPRCMAK